MSLQNWLCKPRATVRIDNMIPWAAWMQRLRRTFGNGKVDMRPGIEVLDRLSLGGKRSLLLIAVGDRRMLIGVGEAGAPSLLSFEHSRQSVGLHHAGRGKRIATGARKGMHR
jgi:flagellar biogenesis protein FliO